MKVGLENNGERVIAESLSAHTELVESPVTGDSMAAADKMVKVREYLINATIATNFSSC